MSNKKIFLSGKGHRSFVPATGDKDQMYFLLYHTPDCVTVGSVSNLEDISTFTNQLALPL